MKCDECRVTSDVWVTRSSSCISSHETHQRTNQISLLLMMKINLMIDSTLLSNITKYVRYLKRRLTPANRFINFCTFLFSLEVMTGASSSHALMELDDSSDPDEAEPLVIAVPL